MSARSVAALLAAGLAALSACTSTTVTPAGPPRSTTTARPTPARTPPTAPTVPTVPTVPTTSAVVAACPATYAAPDPDRPKVSLAFTMSPDLTSATGTEHVQFTPDLPVTELVFRLTANTKPTVQEGNRIVVTSAKADHGARPATYTSADADPSTQGGLLHLAFPSTIPAGTTVTADLTFTLTLGPESFDRFGRQDGFAWFGSAQPLLSWERGYGWHTEPMILFPAESATSEAMDTDLTVTVPGGDTVIMSGDPADPPASSGARTWRSHIDTARDVSVAVGPFHVSDTVVDGVHLRLGAYDQDLVTQLVPEFHRAISMLSAKYGPFPFPSLSVARLPAGGGGIEYPSSILMLDGSRLVAVHETAHQWFYAMVGDSQALHPWLDEAFAQYSEESVDGTAQPSDVDLAGQVDRPTASYGSDEDGYYRVTYHKGAAALFTARTAAGPAAFDAALRCYVNRNAWRIANPSDLAFSLASLPAAIAVLRKAQALP